MLRAVVLLWLLAIPGATALDAFPGHETWGANEARVLLRLPDGGTLRVSADAPVRVALVEPGTNADVYERAPASFLVRAKAVEDSWHGLPGVVELVVRRDDPGRAVRVEVVDGADEGAVYEWAALERDTPGPGPLAVAAAVVGAMLMRRERKRPA